METNEKLIPVFIPALSAVLLHAEQLKTSLLTEDEVLKIRDGSVCMMMSESMAQQLAEKRGYPDINPENCWQEWQILRRDTTIENDREQNNAEGDTPPASDPHNRYL